VKFSGGKREKTLQKTRINHQNNAKFYVKELIFGNMLTLSYCTFGFNPRSPEKLKPKNIETAHFS
jgi:hypothetical protein